MTSKDREIWSIIETVSNEKNIAPDILHNAIAEALTIAVKKHLGDLSDIEVIVNKESFKYDIFRKWLIVADNKKLMNPDREMTLSLAQKKSTSLVPVVEGDYFIEELPKKEFGRIAINAARSIINKIIKSDTTKKIVDKFNSLLYTIVQAEVKKLSKDKILVDIIGHDTEGIIYRSDLLAYDRYRLNDSLKACVVKVTSDASHNYQILLSRTHKKMLQALFQIEIPEIAENIIEIVDIARDPGVRSKVSVRTNDKRLDVIGACIGVKGSRVQAISKELNNEKIDILKWDSDPAKYVMNAIHSEMNFTSITQDELTHTMHIVVPEDRIAQAIGLGGQNVTLASILTSWKIQIMSDKSIAQKTDEYRKNNVQRLQQTLHLTPEQANTFINANINTLEDIESTSVERIAELLDCELEFAHNIKEEATTILLIEELSTETTHEFDNVEGIDQNIIKHLHQHNIYTTAMLAELSIDDLQDIIEITRKEAARIIMSARKQMEV